MGRLAALWPMSGPWPMGSLCNSTRSLHRVSPVDPPELLTIADEGLGDDFRVVDTNPFTARLTALRGEVYELLDRDDDALAAYEEARSGQVKEALVVSSSSRRGPSTRRSSAKLVSPRSTRRPHAVALHSIHSPRSEPASKAPRRSAAAARTISRHPSARATLPASFVRQTRRRDPLWALRASSLRGFWFFHRFSRSGAGARASIYALTLTPRRPARPRGLASQQASRKRSIARGASARGCFGQAVARRSHP